MTNRYYNETYTGSIGQSVSAKALDTQFAGIMLGFDLIQADQDRLAANNVITALSGFPASFAGHAGKQLVVNAAETAIEFVTRGYLNYGTVSGTTYTLVLTDPGRLISFSNASAVTVTVPPNASVGIAIGGALVLAQYGAGKVTAAPGSGVTLRSAGALLSTRAQFSQITLIKLAANEWLVGGDLAA